MTDDTEAPKLYWRTGNLIHSYLLEAAVAEVLQRKEQGDATWFGGNNELFDVSAGEYFVDAKVAFVENVRFSSSDKKEACIGFMGSGRRVYNKQARKKVTHYGLGFIHNLSEIKVATGDDDKSLHLSREVGYSLLLVPRRIINESFRPQLNTDGNRSKGLNYYSPVKALLDLEGVERHGHNFPTTEAEYMEL